MTYDKLITIHTAVTRTTTINLKSGAQWEKESRSTCITAQNKEFDLEKLHNIIVQAVRSE